MHATLRGTVTPVIDINTVFGLRVNSDPRYEPAALSASLTAHQVALAFTCSRLGVDYFAPLGNTATIEACRHFPNLSPVAVVNPRDSFIWQADVDRCLSEGIRLFRFFPRTQGWSPTSRAFRDIVSYLASRKAIIIASVSELGGEWDTARALAEATDGLEIPLIFAEAYYSTLPEVLALMKDHRQIYADTSFLATINSVEQIADAVGYNRLLYGSAAPWHPMQKSLNQVLEARIPDAQKQAILGGTAMQLLGLPATMFADTPSLASLEPLSFDQPVIDIHSHLGCFAIPVRQEDHNPAGMLERMRRLGITRSILSSAESLRYDVASGNRKIAGAIEGHPGLYGMVELDPWHLDLSCAEMDRYLSRPDFAAVEIELSHIACPTGSPQVRALMTEIARRGKPVLFMPHMGDADVEAEIELARANPSLTIVHAHGAEPEWARAVKNTPNICVEYCFSRTTHHRLREGIDILGPERVLFGSDQILLSPAGQIGLYYDANLSPRERQLIMHDNARRLYRL
ncbi:MAG: amidohydrolase family protein [bacterium]